MRGPLPWLVALVVAIAIVVGAIVALSSAFAQPAEPPKQPIRFPHTFHVQVVQIECSFCHRTAATEAQASVPSVQQCMFCHQVAGLQNAEVQKLIATAQEGRPIDWVRVHRVPDHVRFVHAPHIQAGVDCAACHGDVKNMAEVRQVRPLNMRDCVDCHRQNAGPTDRPPSASLPGPFAGPGYRQVSAPTECSACHY